MPQLMPLVWTCGLIVFVFLYMVKGVIYSEVLEFNNFNSSVVKVSNLGWCW